MMRVATLIGVVLVLAAPAARADDRKDQARRDVAAGLAAQGAGHYDEAIALYKRAYEAIPHPELLFNLGQACRLKGDAEAALGYYRRYLAAEPNGRAAGDAQRWIDALGKRPVPGPAEPAHRAGEPRKPEAVPHPAAGPAEPAHRAGEPRKPEAVPRPGAAGTASAAGTVESPSAEPPREPAPVPSASPAGAAPAPDGSATANLAVTSAPTDAGRSHDQPYTWITAAGGGAVLAGGLVFGGLARSKRNAATAICGSDRVCDTAADTQRANALLAQSRTRGTASTVLVAIGAAGLATSGVLWWLGRRGDAAQTAIAPVAGPGTVGLALGGAF
jgi:hypothetical protein